MRDTLKSTVDDESNDLDLDGSLCDNSDGRSMNVHTGSWTVNASLNEHSAAGSGGD